MATKRPADTAAGPGGSRARKDTSGTSGAGTASGDANQLMGITSIEHIPLKESQFIFEHDQVYTFVNYYAGGGWDDSDIASFDQCDTGMFEIPYNFMAFWISEWEASLVDRFGYWRSKHAEFCIQELSSTAWKEHNPAQTAITFESTGQVTPIFRFWKGGTQTPPQRGAIKAYNAYGVRANAMTPANAPIIASEVAADMLEACSSWAPLPLIVFLKPTARQPVANNNARIEMNKITKEIMQGSDPIEYTPNVFPGWRRRAEPSSTASAAIPVDTQAPSSTVFPPVCPAINTASVGSQLDFLASDPYNPRFSYRSGVDGKRSDNVHDPNFPFLIGYSPSPSLATGATGGSDLARDLPMLCLMRLKTKIVIDVKHDSFYWGAQAGFADNEAMWFRNDNKPYQTLATSP